MRIVLHHRTQGQGVEGVHLLGMARGFADAGAEVSIVSPPGVAVGSSSGERHESNGHAAKARTPWRALAERLPEFLFEILEIAYNVPAYFRLRRALRSSRADALYERYAFFNVAGAMAARAAGVPLILEVNYTARTPLYRKRSRALLPIARAVERFVFGRATVIAAVSTVLSRQIIESGVTRERVVISPNAADPERFRADLSGRAVRERYGLDGACVVGFTGAFFPWHGVHLLIDALPGLLREVPATSVLLVGDGPERRALEEQVRRAGLTDHVRFTGRVGHDQLPAHVAAFDVAVMPDSNEYGSPMKIYEYMAMGKPVVGPRLGPLEDGIRDGETGILFERLDSSALESALATLLRDESRRRLMGRRAREHVIACHTWTRNAERVLSRLVDGGERR